MNLPVTVEIKQVSGSLCGAFLAGSSCETAATMCDTCNAELLKAVLTGRQRPVLVFMCIRMDDNVRKHRRRRDCNYHGSSGQTILRTEWVAPREHGLRGSESEECNKRLMQHQPINLYLEETAAAGVFSIKLPYH